MNTTATPTPTPIETTYNGVRFRSRLEARWAVFYDALGVRWFYEYEGFELPSGRYLPDFWLPDLDRWIEIKPKSPSESEETRCSELAEHTGKDVLLFFGEPAAEFVPGGPWYESSSALLFTGGGGGDVHYLWCSCPCCGRFGIAFDGRGARVCGTKKCHPASTCLCGDKGYSFDDPRILAAFDKARTTRFW